MRDPHAPPRGRRRTASLELLSALAAALVLLLLPACGGDDGDEGVRGETTPTQVETTSGEDPSDNSGSGDGVETEQGGEGTDDPEQGDQDADNDTDNDTDDG